MGSPFSFGDLVRLVELAHWVKINCIDPEKNPKEKYTDFKEEVNGLGTVLADFEDAIVQAISHLNDCDPQTGLQQYDGLIQQANRLVRTFVTILEDSQRLLASHIKFNNRKGSFFEAAFWHASTQNKMDELRQRIRDHTDKMSLFVNTVTLRLTRENSARTREIHDRVVRCGDKAKLPSFPVGLESKFQEALSRHPTMRISHPSKIPSREGVEIMLVHFQKSTTMSLKASSDQQYLHLLKSHWLVEILLISDAFKQNQPGQLYSGLVEKMRQSIAEEYQRDEIRQYMGRPLRLDTSDFEIWPQKEVAPDPNLTDPLEHEELLLRIPVVSPTPSEKRELFIFRKDIQHFRIVYLRTPTDPNQREKETETFFDLSMDRLVPFYAVTTGNRTEWNMQMFYSSGAAQVDYPLPMRENAFQLQKAFIEYETIAFSEGVSCTATYKKKGLSIRDGLHVSAGEVQLLQMPLQAILPTTAMSRPPHRTINSPPRSMTSSQSGSNFGKATRAFRDANPSLTSISEAASDKTVVVTELPASPLIMAFTRRKTDNTYTFWQFKLDDIELETSQDGQRHLDFRARRNGESFTAHKLSVEEKKLMDWDICSFFLADKLSKAKKPKRSTERQRPEPKIVECMHFTLNFANADARVDFEMELTLSLTDRHKQQNDARRTLGIAHAEAQSPTLEIYTRAPGNRRDSALSSTSTTTLRPANKPEPLPPIRRVPSISLSLFSDRRHSSMSKAEGSMKHDDAMEDEDPRSPKYPNKSRDMG